MCSHQPFLLVIENNHDYHTAEVKKWPHIINMGNEQQHSLVITLAQKTLCLTCQALFGKAQIIDSDLIIE